MVKTNTRKSASKTRTHEGAPVLREDAVARLRRVLNAHMLFEDSFYMDGVSNATAMRKAVVDAMIADVDAAYGVIRAARTEHNIRHASLLAAVTAGTHYDDVGGEALRPATVALVCDVIHRADEMAEVLAMAGVRKAPHVVMAGVRAAFESDKFDEYQLGKYRQAKAGVTMQDAVRVTHPRSSVNPLIAKIATDTLATPDTWETRLSGGEDKRTVFEDLLRGNKLGAMALLRNLRGMEEVGVDRGLIREAMDRANWSRVLPFRFMSAVQHAPGFAKELDAAFKAAVSGTAFMPGKTAVLVDHSGSMTSPLSKHSKVHLWQAGNVMAAAINGDVDLWAWATSTKRMTGWDGLATAMQGRANVGMGTDAGQAIRAALKHRTYDRIIVITDMQFADAHVGEAGAVSNGYTINLSPYSTPGLVDGKWQHLTGFSTATLRWIAEVECARAG